MKEYSKEFCIEKMAQVLEVCRSGYYDFLKKEPSKRALENERLLEKIKESYKKSRGVYGSPRIHKDLKNGKKLPSQQRQKSG